MDRTALVVHTALISLLVVAVWRLWVLARQVRRAGDAAASARSSVSSASASSAALSAYPVDVHAMSASSVVRVVAVNKDNSKPNQSPVQTVPLVMSRSPAADTLAGLVSSGAVEHIIAGAVMFEALPGGAWEPVEGSRWQRPQGMDTVLLWARPVTALDAKKMPFPALGGASAIQLPPAGPGGFVGCIVLAM